MRSLHGRHACIDARGMRRCVGQVFSRYLANKGMHVEPSNSQMSPQMQALPLWGQSLSLSNEDASTRFQQLREACLSPVIAAISHVRNVMVEAYRDREDIALVSDVEEGSGWHSDLERGLPAMADLAGLQVLSIHACKTPLTMPSVEAKAELRKELCFRCVPARAPVRRCHHGGRSGAGCDAGSGGRSGS